MKSLNVLTKVLAAALMATALSAPSSFASSNSACHDTPSAHGSWKALIARQLRKHDPAHATQYTELAAAIIDDNATAIESYIRAGISPDTILNLATPLSLLELSAASCNDDVTRELVRLGASADGVGDSAPLVQAAAKGESDTVKFLILHGANVAKADAMGHTALEDAVRQRQLDTVKLLVTYDAAINRDIGGGATVLDIVAQSPDSADQAIAQELRAHGAISGMKSSS